MVEAHAKMNPSSYYYAFDYKGLFTTYEIAFGVSQVPGPQFLLNCLLHMNKFTSRLSCNFVSFQGV